MHLKKLWSPGIAYQSRVLACTVQQARLPNDEPHGMEHLSHEADIAGQGQAQDQRPIMAVDTPLQRGT